MVHYVRSTFNHNMAHCAYTHCCNFILCHCQFHTQIYQNHNFQHQYDHCHCLYHPLKLVSFQPDNSVLSISLEFLTIISWISNRCSLQVMQMGIFPDLRYVVCALNSWRRTDASGGMVLQSAPLSFANGLLSLMALLEHTSLKIRHNVDHQG